MNSEKLKCYIVNGFLDAGKTTYIQENIFSDFFYKRGSTLILSFEEGEVSYDMTRLYEFKTVVEQYEDGDSIPSFCLSSIEKHHPDRVIVEANNMREDLMNILSEIFRICDVTTLIDGKTFGLYFRNMKQFVQNMIAAADTVIFRNCDSKDTLSPFATDLRLMNNNCIYLWESPMGYSEQAFGLNLPYSLDTDRLIISDEHFPIWFLDVKKSPEHYFNKIIECTLNVQKRKDIAKDHFIAGRYLMPCCPADMQYCGVECVSDMDLSDGDKMHFILKGELSHKSGILFNVLEATPL